MSDDRMEIYDIDDLMDEQAEDAGSFEEAPRYKEEQARPRRDRRTRHVDDHNIESRRPRRKKAGFLTYLIPIAAFIVFVVFATLAAKEWLTYKAAGDEYALIKEKIVIPEDTSEAEDGMTYPALDIDFDSLLATNPEFVCVLYIPALDLYYPVAQADTNEKYLTTTFEGTTNPSGCIFLDKDASPDFSDINTFIYGHNMKNETMFGSLKRFSAEEDLCQTHPYMYVYLADGTVLKYHIFSYYTTPVNDALYNGISTDREYDSYVIRAQSRSYYAVPEEEQDDFEVRPNLLTLSTCWGNDHKNNFVVHGALLGKADTAVDVSAESAESADATLAE